MKTNEDSITKVQRIILYFLGVGLVFWLISSLSDEGSILENNLKVYNSSWDSSVFQVENFLKNNYLINPESYEGIDWSEVNEVSGKENYKYMVRHKYRAKNSLDGYVIENKIFYLDERGNVIDHKDFY